MSAPSWYATGMGPGVVSHDSTLRELPGVVAWLAERSGLVRGLALAIAARRGTLAVIKGLPGTASALVVAALAGRPRIVVLEFIRRPPSPSRSRRLLYELWRRFVEAPAMRRAMAVGHTLTEWEGAQYAREWKLDEGRFVPVRWPLSRHGTSDPIPLRDGGVSVMCSGRAYSDWPTLFAAAEGASWELTVVCAKRDAKLVSRLNTVCAEVRIDLSRADHDAILRRSDVYVIAMCEGNASAGHVRLMAAVEAGVPVVASDVRALAGYAEPDGTALLVRPRDATALRTAVDGLIADPDLRRRLRDTAAERAAGWTYEHYFERMRAMTLAASG